MTAIPATIAIYITLPQTSILNHKPDLKKLKT